MLRIALMEGRVSVWMDERRIVKQVKLIPGPGLGVKGLYSLKVDDRRFLLF